MIKELIAHPDQVDYIVRRAVACVVTKEEHHRLGAVPKGVYGWSRYIHAGIAVVDTVTGKLADLSDLARETDRGQP
jgi:hypothetical protein